jgi:hypothetical protein
VRDEVVDLVRRWSEKTEISNPQSPSTTLAGAGENSGSFDSELGTPGTGHTRAEREDRILAKNAAGEARRHQTVSWSSCSSGSTFAFPAGGSDLLCRAYLIDPFE